MLFFKKWFMIMYLKNLGLSDKISAAVLRWFVQHCLYKLHLFYTSKGSIVAEPNGHPKSDQIWQTFGINGIKLFSTCLQPISPWV